MVEERRQIKGDLLVEEPYTLWGSVGGDVTVVEGGKLYVRGAVYGDLILEFGGRVHVFGNITGRVSVARGSKVIISGTIGGDIINEGGRLYIDNLATVMGTVKTLKGDTKIDRHAKVRAVKSKDK